MHVRRSPSPVSFGGTSSDVPVLQQRIFRFAVTCETIYQDRQASLSEELACHVANTNKYVVAMSLCHLFPLLLELVEVVVFLNRSLENSVRLQSKRLSRNHMPKIKGGEVPSAMAVVYVVSSLSLLPFPL